MIAKDKRYGKFIILSSPRSGTHMLRTTLQNHVNIVARSELFNPDFISDLPFGPQTPAGEILNQYIYRDYPRHIKMAGFILHRSGTPFGDWPDLWPRLEADQSIAVISLRRRNLLRRYLSYQVMRTFKGSSPTPLYFDPEILENDFIYQRQEVEAFDQRFAGHPVLKVNYEDLCEHFSTTITRVQQFLKVPPQQLWPNIQGKPQRKLSEAISNFAELKSHFSKTEWASFFNDEVSITHINRPEKKVKTPTQSNPLLDRLSNSSLLKPYVHFRNRYHLSWWGMAKIRLKDFWYRHYQQLIRGKTFYYQNLPKTGWALYSEKIEELLIRSFFQDRRNGIFLDVGCAWPITHSNTFYLEKHLGWSGVAVDANPVELPEWKKYRPNCQLLTYIISDQSKSEASFYKSGPLGSTQKERSIGVKIVRGKEIKLPAITLTELLEEQQIEKIDFLSIDIEESELKALRGFDINRFQPDLICIEVFHQYKEQVLKYFAQHQYKMLKDFLYWDKVNLYFIKKKA